MNRPMNAEDRAMTDRTDTHTTVDARMEDVRDAYYEAREADAVRLLRTVDGLQLATYIDDDPEVEEWLPGLVQWARSNSGIKWSVKR